MAKIVRLRCRVAVKCKRAEGFLQPGEETIYEGPLDQLPKWMTPLKPEPKAKKPEAEVEPKGQAETASQD